MERIVRKLGKRLISKGFNRYTRYLQAEGDDEVEGEDDEVDEEGDDEEEDNDEVDEGEDDEEEEGDDEDEYEPTPHVEAMTIFAIITLLIAVTIVFELFKDWLLETAGKYTR